MKVVKAELKTLRDKGLDIEFSNGIRNFIISIDKEDLTYEDILNFNVSARVTLLSRNCCKAIPVNILEFGKTKEDDEELADVINQIIQLIGNDIREKLINKN